MINILGIKIGREKPNVVAQEPRYTLDEAKKLLDEQKVGLEEAERLLRSGDRLGAIRKWVELGDPKWRIRYDDELFVEDYDRELAYRSYKLHESYGSALLMALASGNENLIDQTYEQGIESLRKNRDPVLAAQIAKFFKDSGTLEKILSETIPQKQASCKSEVIISIELAQAIGSKEAEDRGYEILAKSAEREARDYQTRAQKCTLESERWIEFGKYAGNRMTPQELIKELNIVEGRVSGVIKLTDTISAVRK